MADGAALILPVVPAAGGHAQRAIKLADGAASGGRATLRRFLRADEYSAIEAAIQNGDEAVTLGRYFTPDAIADPAVATMQLALPGTSTNAVVGYVDVPLSSLPAEPLVAFGPRQVVPFRGEDLIGLPGGGLEVEFMIRPLVPTSGLTLVPTGPR